MDWWPFLAASNTGGRAAATRPIIGLRGGGAGGVGADVVAALHSAHEMYRGPLADGMGAEWVLSLREAARRMMVCVKPEPEFRSITDSWPLSWDTRRV